MTDNNNDEDPLEPKMPALDNNVNQRLKLTKAEFAKRNLKLVYGSGAGRIVIIVGIFFSILFICIAIRGFTSNKSKNNLDGQVDLVKIPVVKVNNDPVTKSEVNRHNQINAKEANDALQHGDSYQPPFESNVTQDRTSQIDDHIANQGSMFSDNQIKALSLEDDGNAAQPNTTKQVVKKQNNDNKDNNTYNLSEEEKKKLNSDYQIAINERNNYEAELKKQALEQMKLFLGDGQKDTLNDYGNYKTIDYTTKTTNTVENKQLPNQSQNTQDLANNNLTNLNKDKGKLLIKTGKSFYSTLDSAINTDKGSDVRATIRVGPWKGSVLIGKVTKVQDDINLIFTTLAPQDDRPTMKINAVALSEKDASEGMAENIDNHTIQRWGSLFLSSILSGYGKAFENIGSTTSSGLTTTTTKTDPSNKEIVGNAIGQIGDNASTEIKKGFDRDPTYKTSAQTGFALYFLSDVYESN
jgi:intracellular multiplication protein IcmE